MTKQLPLIALVFAFAIASSAVVRTQEKPAPAPAKVAPPSGQIPLRLTVLVSRYQGEKKVSSLPYTLSVTAGHNANLRMGAKVPVMMITAAKLPAGVPQVGPIQYQEVGTNIDCTVSTIQDDGRFQVVITIDDSSVYGDAPVNAAASAPPSGNPSFRSFRASDSMMLKDGQTAQFTTASDKVSGEVVKVDVTLTVVK